MNERRWQAGQRLHHCGMPFRVVEGHLFPGDLVLQWQPASRWVGVTLSALALQVDFIAQNEDARYQRGRGGRMTLDYLESAWQEGWRNAHA